MMTTIGGAAAEIAAHPVRQYGSVLFVSRTYASAMTQSYSLCQFVQRMLARHPLQSHGIAASQVLENIVDAPAPAELSASVAPLTPPGQHIAFDLAALRHLRDTSKLAVLAPACLERDLAGLPADRAERLAALFNLQDALRTCTALAVFDAAHVRLLSALGARRIGLVTLPALPPPVDVPPSIDVLLIQHELAGGSFIQSLEKALHDEMPALTVRRYSTDLLAVVQARIHVHVGDPGADAPVLRVIDSHAMQRVVLRLPTNASAGRPDDGMQVVPLATGLTAANPGELVRAPRWLLAHPVFEEIFRRHAAAALERFNREAEARLRQALE